MEFKPYEYQKYCIDKILELPNLALWLDMGLGKTVITLEAIQQLIYDRFEVQRVLIIAPKKVAEATWTDEANKWDNLQGLRISRVLGTAQQRTKALEERADIYIINRENVQWLVRHSEGGYWPFDMVVLDESTSFKNYAAKRFRYLRTVRKRITRLIELTGTPSPHGLMDLWAQIFLIDGGARLGRNITAYRETFFDPNERNRVQIFSYKPKPGAEEQIYRLLSDCCISMKAADYIDVPDIIYDTVPVTLDDKAAAAYKVLEKTELLQYDETTITAGTAGALVGKLLQLCNGASYNDKDGVTEIHDCKLCALDEVIEQLGGQHAIIFYHFKHDLDRILQRYPNARQYRNARDAERWNNGEIELLVAHPASCGYGLNLQGGGHHIIWFGLTWSLEEYQQANARLHRQGQSDPVIIHNLVVRGGIDEDVMRSLSGKSKAQDSLIEALKSKILKAKERQ